MNNAQALELVARPPLDAKVIEQVVLGGDLSKLSTDHRLAYYQKTCESLGLNPLTKPFAYLALNGKTVLYATKDCTEQLRKIHSISVTIAAREVVEGCYVVTAHATMAGGREDESIGAVPIDGLKGEARSNAMMKAETKAKRRVTLSICGLGLLDETEVDAIPTARIVAEPVASNDPPAGYDDWFMELTAASHAGTDALKTAWDASAVSFRAHLTKHHSSEWMSLKQCAAKVAS